MHVIDARGINEAWDSAKRLLNKKHEVRPSRVGEVWEYPTAVSTVYHKPCERVLFNRERHANPYFHFMESLWMLAGRNDVAFLEIFNSKITEFVGPGPNLHDAYGHRWRFAFDLEGGGEDGYSDQLPKIARMLKKSPDERRAVLTMWNPIWDLERPDLPSVPCNTQAYFKIRQKKYLSMLVTCRSNDICMGAYGANAVHFSFLHEYMAAQIGVEVGTYTQVSDSWHAYTARWNAMGGLDASPSRDYYAVGLKTYPLVSDPESFDEELAIWLARQNEHEFRNRFFPDVAEHLYQSWMLYKEDRIEDARNRLVECEAEDWSIAARLWLSEVQRRRRQKQFNDDRKRLQEYQNQPKEESEPV